MDRDVLDSRWEAKPHACHLDSEGNQKPYAILCHSYIIPDVIYEPIDKKLAERIVSDHNNALEATVMSKPDMVIDCPCLDRDMGGQCTACSDLRHDPDCALCHGERIVTVSPLAHEGGR